MALGDLVSIKHGFAFKGEYFTEEPQSEVLLSPGNFSAGGGFKDDKFKYYSGPVPPDYVLSAGDILVTMTDLSKSGDTLGYPARVPSSPNHVFLHNQRLGSVTPIADDLDIDYMYYALCESGYRNEVLASATGSTVRHTSPGRIYLHKIALPPPPTQRAIGTTLRLLDTKVESNRRSIRILHLLGTVLCNRVLGSNGSQWENAWPDSPLGASLRLLETGKRPRGGVAKYQSGTPSIGAESIKNAGHFDFAKTKYVPDELAQSMQRGTLQGGFKRS